MTKSFLERMNHLKTAGTKDDMIQKIKIMSEVFENK